MSFLNETGLIFWAHLRANLRNPLWVLIGLTQPILYLVLFGPLLEGVAGSMGAGTDPWLVFTPGLIMQIGLFGSMFAGFAMVYELRAGIIERQRVTPASRGALLLGRVLKDMVVLMVQASILTLVAVLLFDLRPNPLGFVLTLILVAIIEAGMSSASYALALATRSEDSLASVLNMVSVPLLLLSGILLPMALAPGWLDVLSHFMPFRYLVDAVRAAFTGDYASTAMLYGVLVAAALGAGAVTVGTRVFQRAGA